MGRNITISKKKLTIALSVILVLIVGTVTAFFTSTDTKTNTITIGTISISVDEGSWDADKAKNMTPNQTVSKQPSITNTSSSNTCYCFFKVEVPRENSADVFNYTTNAGWTKISTSSTSTTSTYVYAYGTSSTMTKLSAGATTGTLFDSITLDNRESFSKSSYDVVVTGYGIQTENLGSATTPAQIYALF